ncbi:MAG: DUF2278 family protein [Thermomicrobiales bacterium]
MKPRPYGIFSGRVLDRKSESNDRSPHFHILLEGGGEQFRAAINTRSGTSHHRQADLLFLADDDYRHPVTNLIGDVDDGFVPVESRPGGLALDYQRGGLFDRRHMRRIPASLPGAGNDLVDELDYRVSRAIEDPTIRIHVYGTRWGPEPRIPDQIFRFRPGNGMHDVHMNQGNEDEHRHDNNTWSDGALIFHEPQRDRWLAIFLAFQTQSWHTDDDGNPLHHPEPAHDNGHFRGESGLPLARIVAAFVHPNEEKTGVEHVEIRNDEHQPLSVEGWGIANRVWNVAPLSGHILPHQVRRFPLPDDVQLSTRGGVIRLLDAAGNEVDGVSYTRREARHKHGSLKF